MKLSKQYNPQEAEKNRYKIWERNGYFLPEVNQKSDAETYSIVIPPPNVTGSLHMGHALQHTVMDVLIRQKRMLGYKTLFLPGLDHAGISTQIMVARQLKKNEGKTPREIGRKAFMKKVWDWKRKHGGTILGQMRREGLSVDWSRERFTMDEDLSRAVTNVFVTLYKEGLIYRGTRIVNWCPKDRTVLSDLEIENKEKKDGKLYYLQYPIKPAETQPQGNLPKTLTVATTRPETMLGDTAVAVNPNDERFKDLIGGKIELPLTAREIPIIADKYVDMKFGTGAVKITPAHDPNDYEMGQRQNLRQINVMNLDGTMNKNAGKEFNGLDRYKARKLVIEKFEKLGLLEKTANYEMVLPVCERCKTIVETLVSEQWWVKMEEMRDMALKLKLETDYPRFTPHNPHTKVYIDWLKNLRDWTISRQLWWGHQIPAWYDEEGKIYVAKNREEASNQAGTENLTQDEDVLDTWFSSWLWSFSAMGWTGEENWKMGMRENAINTTATQTLKLKPQDLKDFHPTSILVTAQEIIFLWVSRMVMSALKFCDERPFDEVYITGTVLDKEGQRMSKTKGNGIDPIEVFDKYGVDATRMTLAGSSTGANFAWRDEKVESYRNFANKIWNASRFCLMNSEGAKIDLSSIGIHGLERTNLARRTKAERKQQDRKTHIHNEENFLRHTDKSELEGLSIVDKWIISRLNKTAIEVNKSIDKYAFHTAVDLLYHFFWDDFCDWYIELVKDEITAACSKRSEISSDWIAKDEKPTIIESTEDSRSYPRAASVLIENQIRARTRIITILDQALRLLHPFMPYLTEELWQKLPNITAKLHNSAYKSAEVTIMLADFPKGNEKLIDEKAESEMKMIIELITKIRNIRAEVQIKSSTKVEVYISTNSKTQKIFGENKAQILKLARAKEINLGENLDIPKNSAKSILTNGTEIAIPLKGLIDFDKERSRLKKQLNNLKVECEKLSKQLLNEHFIKKAPTEKVKAVKERVAEIELQTRALNENIESLE